MKFKMNKKRNAGFTLVEILAATAIVVILLAVGMVSVVRYARLLQITELDNAAREIYMAAENRAVLLTSSGRMEAMRSGTGTSGSSFKKLSAGVGAGGADAGKLGNYYIYHAKNDESVLTDLLPEGTVDPALRKGCFYVVYNIVTDDTSGEEKLIAASVTDVFYAEDASELGNGTALNNDPNGFYMTWRTSSRSDRLEDNRMLGYFGSASVDSGTSTPLYEPIVEIINGEELKVRVKYTARNLTSPTDPAVTLKVWLTYQGQKIDLTLPSPETDYAGFGMTTYTYTWVLDTLKGGGSRSKDIFKETGMTLGEDFTASAYVQRGDIKSKTKSDTGNTLFADETHDGPTAYIENLRHLQNLDTAFSGVKGKTKAVQVADIAQSASELDDYKTYKFEPIENKALTSYDGGSKFIKGLNVTTTSTGKKPAAGLFATASSTGTNPWSFQNVRLVNTSVNAGTGKNAGALVGSASNASFENCWVYWESDGGKSPKELLKENDQLAYQITGSTAGGLVGELSGGTIKNCLAATLVQGTTAGGMVGSVQGSQVKVTNSYADCYLDGATAGGLIGSADGTVNLDTVYTAGFLYDYTNAAGFCNAGNESTVSAQDAYSAMYYEKTGDDVRIAPLAPGVEDTSNCHYLTINNDHQDKSYKDMAEPTFFETMKEGFERKGLDQSQPYELLTDLDTYPLPVVKGLPQYGDWNAEFLNTSLVYYEKYEDDSYGVSGGNVGTLVDKTVIKDGYALLFNKQEDMTITFTQKNSNDGNVMDPVTKAYTTNDFVEVTSGSDPYSLLPLPDELITTDYADPNFYQFLNIKLGDAGDKIVAAYNPHFAKTASTMREGEEVDTFKKGVLAAVDRPMDVSVRTARHLNELSKHSEYYHTTKAGRLFSFRQELDLDYRKYTGYDGWTEGKLWEQEPIGRQNSPFNGRYYGGCHEIRGVAFQIPKNSGQSYAGLFGVSTGLLQDIVYHMDPEKQARIAIGSETEIYLGALVGGVESGEVNNCAVYGVSLCGVASKTTIYMGALVGQNKGSISNCAAESAQLKTEDNSFSMAYCGGLVGQNYTGGYISNCYAVGYVTAEVDQNSAARVCGFAGFNRGDIHQCYSATYLESSGADVTTYGFCGAAQGAQSGNCYLNQGNFTFRQRSYNANYETAVASPVVYDKLIKRSTELGMGRAQATVTDEQDAGSFPYPTGVRNAKGQYVHYGQWPDPVDLGQMGVYYWEKLELGNKVSYNVSLLAADVQKTPKTVTKEYILSKERSNGSEVTDYGYGWYSSDVGKVTVSSEGLKYTTDGSEDQDWSSDLDSVEDADDALKILMPEYTFHSYRSFVPNPDPSKTEIIQAGLYSAGIKGEKGNLISPNSRITLTYSDENAVTFTVNPHFADALSVNSVPDGWKVADENLKTDPGQKDNPYEVRAIGQLSAINWNSTNRNTKTVMVGESNNNDNTLAPNTSQFPYLSTSNSTGKYVWKQTHDIHGNSGVYTPIAEYYDTPTDGNNLLGWFGGTFDGDDYVIENVNIQGQTSTVAGLFGAVYNGSLRNIVLHSSDGEGYVTSSFETEKMLSGCYYMGTLAGLASSNNGNAVENCSASGYTIYAKTYNTHDNQWGTSQAGGSGIGGLLGVSDMDLKNCSAVTTIRIVTNPQNHYGNDNLRAGGLVGISKKTIENCYAGGEILVGGMLNNDGTFNPEGTVRVKAANGLFLGGIVGGSYFTNMGLPAGQGNIGGGGNNTLTNCYSYVVLPSQEKTELLSTKKQVYGKNESISTEKTYIRGLYAIGGVGDDPGTCTITNCYYLESEVMKNNLDGFDMTTTYNGGSDDGSSLKNFKLKTDLDLTRDSVQVVPLRSDNLPLRVTNVNDPTSNNGAFVERRISLTSDDVGKEFLISYQDGDGGYTYHSPERNSLTIVINGTNEQCLYVDKTSSCMPIFTFDKDGPHASGAKVECKYVTFRGWATEINGNQVTAWTTDPTTLPVSDWNSLMAVTYDQLKVSNGTGAVLSRLGAFAPVTATDEGSGLEIPGKYSYRTEKRKELRGLDYPFPTILTRSGGIHVHYGDWPLNGIQRDKGAEPIERDLFIKSGGGDVEQLRLNVPTGGTWGVTSGNQTIAAAAITPTGQLTVTGVSAGVTTITVSYTVGDLVYTLPITVRVTAVLELVAEQEAVYLFQGAETDIPLKLVNKQGDEVDLTKYPEFSLALDDSSTYDSKYLEESALVEDEDTGGLVLKVRAGNNLGELKQDLSNVGILLRYNYDNGKTGDEQILKEYSTVNSIPYTVLAAPTFEEPKQQESGALRYTLQLPEALAGYSVLITKAEVAGTSNVKVTVSQDRSDPWAELSGYAEDEESVDLALTLRLYNKDGVQVGVDQIGVQVTVGIPEGYRPKPDPEPEPPDGLEEATAAGETQGEEPEPAAGEEAKLPEEPEPALPVEEKTDPVPEKDAGAGKDGTVQ